jgi:putative heme-binding domain-containing protein
MNRERSRDEGGAPRGDAAAKRRLSGVAFTALVAGAWLCRGAALQAEPANLDDDPTAVITATTLPENYELQLVAMEPDVINPIQINFDTQGRLWVMCVPGYPQILPGQAPQDYVVVLEDFGPDGRAKKVRKVVTGLTIPTGMMPGDGGVYVGQGESLLFFRERDGGVEKRVALAGFGTNDTHHTLNTFRWGPEGRLYFNQGVYIKSTVETPYGLRRQVGGGIWQLRTDRMKLELFDRSIEGTNTWGHDFDAWGRAFISTAWKGDLNQVVPDAPLAITRIGGERHCGLAIVGGRHLPDDMQGNFITGDFLSHHIYRYEVEDLGNRFLAKRLPSLAQSKHPRFRPVDIRMGPDGAIYVADLFQRIIQHNQVDFRDPRRDHTRGRVWRIVRKDRPLVEIPKLVGVPAEQVVARLKDPEPWTRLHARRALMEGDARAAKAAVDAFVAALDERDPATPQALLEALWTYQALDEVAADFLRRLLKSPDPRIRGAATKVVGEWQDRLPDAVGLLAKQAADPHPRVRLEAVLAARHIATAAAFESALVAVDHPLDPLLEFSLRRAATALSKTWVPEFRAGNLTFDGKSNRLAFALQAVKVPDANPRLADLVIRGSVTGDDAANILLLLASTKDYRELALERAMVAEGGFSAAQRARIIEAIERSLPSQFKPSEKQVAAVKKLIDDPSPAVAAAGLRLAAAMRATDPGTVEAIATAAQTDPVRREAAIVALARLQGKAAAPALIALAAADRPAETRIAAIAGLLAVDVQAAADRAAVLLEQPVGGGVELEPLFTAFVQTKGGAETLATALQARKPGADAARVGMRTLAELGVSPPALAAVLEGASTATAARQRVLDVAESKRLLGLVAKEGDPARGEAIFRRSALACLSCHALGGAGGIVGPDLSAIGTSAQPDYLLESIVMPSKKVREGYNTANVVTTSGKVIRGIVQRESPQELVIRDPKGVDIVLTTADIEEKVLGGSLMPEGLDRALTDAELVDLVRFLSELGRPGPFGVSHVSVARRWEVLTDPPATFRGLDPRELGRTLKQDAGLAWKAGVSRVAGGIPLDEFAKAPDVVFLRTEIEVITPGTFGFDIGPQDGVQVWADDAPLAAAERTTCTLSAGFHTLTFRVDMGRRANSLLRCEFVEVPGGGRARFVSQAP